MMKADPSVVTQLGIAQKSTQPDAS